MKYRFITDRVNEYAKINKRGDKSYYQIAQFPLENKHFVRKLIINHNLDIVDIKTYCVSRSRVKSLIKFRKQTEYKLYPVYELDEVELPKKPELVALDSELMN